LGSSHFGSSGAQASCRDNLPKPRCIWMQPDIKTLEDALISARHAFDSVVAQLDFWTGCRQPGHVISSEMLAPINVHIALLSGKTFADLSLCRSTTVKDVCRHLAEQHDLDVPAARIRLVLGQRTLRGHEVLGDLELSTSHQITLQLIKLDGYEFGSWGPCELCEAGTLELWNSGTLELDFVKGSSGAPGGPDLFACARCEASGEVHNFTFMLLGAENVGKTCITYRFILNELLARSPPTFGFNAQVKRVLVNDESRAQLLILDMGGNRRFREVHSKQYYHRAHAILIVFDITERESFETVGTLLDLVHENAREDAIIWLIGNKTDLVAQRQVSTPEAAFRASQLGLKYFEMSCQEGDSVEAPFHQITGQLLDRTVVSK